VVHRDISEKDIDVAIASFKEVAPRMWPRPQVAPGEVSANIPITIPPATTVSQAFYSPPSPSPPSVSTATTVAAGPSSRTPVSPSIVPIASDASSLLVQPDAVTTPALEVSQIDAAAAAAIVAPDITGRLQVDQPPVELSSLVLEVSEGITHVHSVDSDGQNDYSPACVKDHGVQSLLSAALR
jgi:hypothetical protein